MQECTISDNFILPKEEKSVKLAVISKNYSAESVR